jgi:hypothetical protein
MRQRGTYKIRGKVAPKRSADDLARLAQAMGFPPETEWWNPDEAFEGLLGDVDTWHDGVVDDAFQAWVDGGGDAFKFVPPRPRRPRQRGNEGGVGIRVYKESYAPAGNAQDQGEGRAQAFCL